MPPKRNEGAVDLVNSNCYTASRSRTDHPYLTAYLRERLWSLTFPTGVILIEVPMLSTPHAFRIHRLTEPGLQFWCSVYPRILEPRARASGEIRLTGAILLRKDQIRERGSEVTWLENLNLNHGTGQQPSMRQSLLTVGSQTNPTKGSTLDFGHPV